MTTTDKTTKPLSDPTPLDAITAVQALSSLIESNHREVVTAINAVRDIAVGRVDQTDARVDALEKRMAALEQAKAEEQRDTIPSSAAVYAALAAPRVPSIREVVPVRPWWRLLG